MHCPSPPRGATEVCVARTCQVGTVSCPSGTGNCDRVDANGCEVNTLTDVMNCGPGASGDTSCGHRCPTTGGTPSCVGGMCRLDCFGDFGDCDGLASNGCEAYFSDDVMNCGACGHPCSIAHGTSTCSAGLCRLEYCSAMFADCNANLSDGCEAALSTDRSNCGSCGHTCAAGQECVAGSCVLACPSSQTNCSDVCRDLQTDTSNCGGCFHYCRGPIGGRSTCVAGVCGAECPAALTLCGTGCYDLQSAANNCGACGHACGDGMTCRNGICASL